MKKHDVLEKECVSSHMSVARCVLVRVVVSAKERVNGPKWVGQCVYACV